MIRCALLVIIALACCSCRNPVVAPRLTESQQPLNQTRGQSSLEGKWQVFSASHQTSGNAVYTFRGDTLVIEGQHRPAKSDSSPSQPVTAKWNFRIDDTNFPHRLVMTPSDSSGDSQVHAFEIRSGELWMCRDFGDQPINSASLRPGSGGWVTGLRRVE